MKIFQRVAVTFFLTLGLFSVSLSIVSPSRLVDLFLADKVSTLNTSVASSVKENAFLFFGGYQYQINEWLESVLLLDNVVQTGLLDSQNNIISYKSSNVLVPKSSLTWPDLVKDLDDRFHPSLIPLELHPDGSPNTYSHVFLVIKVERQAIENSIIRSILFSIGTAFLFISPILYFLSRYLSSPIILLNRSFAKIDPDENLLPPLDIDNRAPIEVKEVSITVNRLLKRLSEHHQLLDDKVATRTKLLEVATQKTLESERVKQNIASTLSHDLKSPLSAINNYIELVYENISQGDKTNAIENSKKALSQVDRMTGEIGNILRILSSGLQETDFLRSVNISEMIGASISNHSIITRSKGSKVVVAGDESLSVYIDVLSFAHILDNLFKNANEHGCPGVIEISFEFDDQLKVMVSNPIDPNNPPDLEGLFDQNTVFSSAADLNKGLGLYLCKQRLSDIGGEMTARLTKNNRIQIVFKLPNKGR